VPGLNGPLKLLGGYDQASFESGIGKLRVSYELVMQQEQQLKLTRMRRNLVQDNVYATLRGYRATIQAHFPKDDPLVLTLPRLTPTRRIDSGPRRRRGRMGCHHRSSGHHLGSQ